VGQRRACTAWRWSTAPQPEDPTLFSHHLAIRLLVAGALVGGSTAMASPAVSADTWTTTVTAVPTSTVLDFGETVDIDLDVDSQSGFTPTGGTATLYAKRATATEWRAVATTSPTSVQFTDVKPRMNTSYKVAYSGYKATSAGGDSYSSSESGAFQVDVARTISRPKAGFAMKGRVRPDYARKKIIVKISRKQHSGYSRYRVIRTDERGRYRLTLPRRQGTWFWVFQTKGDLKYRRASFGWRTWVS
jgi:hypothetical protein